MEDNQIFILSRFDKVDRIKNDPTIVTKKAYIIGEIIKSMNKNEKIEFMEEKCGSLDFLIFNQMWMTTTEQFIELLKQYPDIIYRKV